MTSDEIEQMRSHPLWGEMILDHIHYLDEVLPGIRSHHERSDGKGYPDGLRGKAIPILARIIAVADAYDAMTSDRPYRKSVGKREAVQEIMAFMGSQFDIKVASAFLEAFCSGDITGKGEELPSEP